MEEYSYVLLAWVAWPHCYGGSTDVVRVGRCQHVTRCGLDKTWGLICIFKQGVPLARCRLVKGIRFWPIVAPNFSPACQVMAIA